MDNYLLNVESAGSLFGRVFQKGMTSLSNSSERIQARQIIRENVSNSFQQVQSSQPQNSAEETVAEIKPTSNVEEFNDDKKLDPFVRLQCRIRDSQKQLITVQNLLNEKERLLNNFKQSHENLVRNVSNLKLDNENINLKFQDEIKKRSEIEEKMVKVWSLIEALKRNTDVLEDRLVKFETLELEITDFTNVISKEVEELKNKFVRIKVVYEENCNKFKAQIDTLHQQREEAEENFRVETKYLEDEITKLTDECSQKREQIEKLSLTVKDLNEKINEEKEEKDKMKDETTSKLNEMNDIVEKSKLQTDDFVREKSDILKGTELVKEENKRLEETLQEKEIKLTENKDQLLMLANKVEEMETVMQIREMEIAALLTAQNALNTEISAVTETKNNLEVEILQMKEEKNQLLEKNKYELNECRANFAQAKEAKEDCEKQIVQLTGEIAKLKTSCEHLENLHSGTKFDMKLQAQKFNTTISTLDEKIKQQNEEYKKLLKAIEEKELRMKQQKQIDSKAIIDLKKQVKKQEEDIIALTEKNKGQVDEINTLKGNLVVKTRTVKKATVRVATRGRPSTRGLAKKEASSKNFTPTDDSHNSQEAKMKENVAPSTPKKRVSFSPVISSFPKNNEEAFDKMVNTPPEKKKKCSPVISSRPKINETCYGTPRRSLCVSAQKLNLITETVTTGEAKWNDSDDIFGFNGD